MNLKTLSIFGLGSCGICGGLTGTYFLVKGNSETLKTDSEITSLLASWISDTDDTKWKEQKTKVQAIANDAKKSALVASKEKGNELMEKFKENPSSEEDSLHTKIKEFCTAHKKSESIKKPEDFDIMKEICTQST